MSIELPKKLKKNYLSWKYGKEYLKYTGQYYISYSQLSTWWDLKGFNTGLLGKAEYIRSKFLDETYPQTPWGTFGDRVEDYICNRKGKEHFSPKERKTLQKIKPLGVFQEPLIMKFNGFVVIGFKDDVAPDRSLIRDYKTASKPSSKKYEKDDYYQLDIYALDEYKRTGKIPNLEVLVIERLGGGDVYKGAGIEALSVGEKTWTIPRKTNKKRLKEVENKIISTVEEISEYYKVFKKINL